MLTAVCHVLTCHTAPLYAFARPSFRCRTFRQRVRGKQPLSSKWHKAPPARPCANRSQHSLMWLTRGSFCGTTEAEEGKVGARMCASRLVCLPAISSACLFGCLIRGAHIYINHGYFFRTVDLIWDWLIVVAAVSYRMVNLVNARIMGRTASQLFPIPRWLVLQATYFGSEIVTLNYFMELAVLHRMRSRPLSCASYFLPMAKQ